MKILVTGACGSVGRVLCPKLRELGHKVFATDIAGETSHYLDVTSWADVRDFLDLEQPDWVIHLAGFKQAPEGELKPWEVTRVNVQGTHNVVTWANRVLFASTCKACDPETAYGASKLIAEREVLNAGGTVARFYNVREADGNVFRYWESLPEDTPIPYTDCTRFFITMDQAVDLLVKCLDLPSGRYTVDPGFPKAMRIEAGNAYPKRKLTRIPRRRGDRLAEKVSAQCESLERLGDGLLQINSVHDV